ncbi:McrB family protein [Lentilactobacillus buchneri]|uniref:GTPase subunit of restriction endonuclease n=1 Tax=Lentilactobacillus buchneri subsp. silagei CD034 TaxID=1071400 RepID=J9W0G6_LENBU|nr:AAA family ATPase [Lentilactobacillus buchneri]MCC6100719.1 AAA family ATPase [Lactobacillus sp.]AFR99226.1 GTPase subunit of restriction endonuclease [Lentilactobacillus buchneri subsp. silagei CD034]MCT2900665.1 AAA family ATPase [Lentilactobacillus buchneri]MCT3542547.1 AAA family ATPase [Lentilactobacillus buchneri]MCT3545933.1 AAA family ATPase [Lentilactobacillus buchneri]
MTTPKEILVDGLQEFAKKVGGKSRNGKELFITRTAVTDQLTPDGKQYTFISLIRNDQQASGPYSGISLKVNPGINHYRISLDIGSEGFGDDYQLVATPGTRRRFVELQSVINEYSKENRKQISCFCALNFTDNSNKQQLKNLEKQFSDDNINSHPQDLFVVYVDKPTIDNGIHEDEDFWKIYKAMVGTYSEIRNWPNKGERSTINKFKNAFNLQASYSNEDLAQVKNLLSREHYVVIQGAPGVGKTYLTSQLAQEYNPQNIIFTQFHAETTYSDFIGGYKPVQLNTGLSYQYQEGPLLKAIRQSIAHPENNVLLIIDEINRANLSNVLGESFYLFEKSELKNRSVIHLGEPANDVDTARKPLSVKQLPKNLYVVATMNTADRSLAVIDFALRRRFAWYTIIPHKLVKSELRNNEDFHSDEFDRIHDIFQEYATSQELMMEPGQSYFITEKGQSIKERIQYELLPLIREYLDNGYLANAADEFNQFFIDTISTSIYL